MANQDRVIAALAAMMVALCGANVAWVIALVEPGAFAGIEVLIAATAGAGLAGALTAPGFGRDGMSGWMLALLSAVMATGLGGAAAAIGLGGIDLVLNDTMLIVVAPVVVFAMIIGHPGVGATWALLMAASHLVVRAKRRRKPVPDR